MATWDLSALDIKALQVKVEPKQDPLHQHAAAMARGADCERCPLYGCGEGPVLGEIVPGSPVTYVGEAPGHNEVAKGQVFIGASGAILDEAIREGGSTRERTSVTNAILCRPPGGDMQAYLKRLRSQHKIAQMVAKADAKPAPAEPALPSDCCHGRLLADLEEANSVVVCAVGSEALRAIARAYGVPHGSEKAPPGTPRLANMKKQHGSPIVLPNGRVLMASLHPAFAMHGSKEFMPTIKADLARATRIAMRGGKLDWTEPEFILDPTLDVAVGVMDYMRQSGARVTVDIETDSANSYTTRLRCVGLAATIEGREIVICVPIIKMAGGQWWTEGARVQIYAALNRLLEQSPLAGQNLSFDTLVLLRYQLMQNRGKLWADPMLMHHDSSSSELPHDLGFISARNFEMPRWKDDADSKVVDNVSDHWLHLYCCRDCLSEMRLLAPLWQQTTASMMTKAFEVDTQLAPVARDMGALGLNINEDIRHDLYQKLETVRVARLADVRRIVGIPDFNPNSFKQVARFLYVTNRLTPPFGADGKDWKMPDGVSAAWEDDEEELSRDAEDALLAATTNEEALLRLLDLGCSAQVAAFIEAQLQFRGMAKILGTYIGYKMNDEGILEDRMRMRGRLLDEVWPTVSPNPLAILHTNWGIHVVPSGRWNSKPNCFDAVTEVLTRRGWIKFPDLRGGEEVAQWHEDGSIDFVPPTARQVLRYQGEMVSLQSRNVDLRVTADHRCLTRYIESKKLRVTTAAEYPSCALQIHAGCYVGGHGLDLTNAELQLICATQADGTLDTRSSCIEFGLCKQRKIQRLLGILADCGIEPTTTTRHKQNKFGSRVHEVNETRIYIPSCGTVSKVRALLGPQKQLGAWLLEMSRAQMDLFAEEIWLWDGQAARRTEYSSVLEANVDWAQIVVALSNRRARKQCKGRADRRTVYTVGASNTVQSRTSAVKKSSEWVDETVYCVSVPSSYVVVRRGKNVMITGQCQNWPERIVYDTDGYRSSDGKLGIVNTRTMVQAVPGHVFVGADYEQIELLLYAVQAGDQIILNAKARGLDLHAMNYANMQGGADKNAVEKWYQYVRSLEKTNPKLRKHVRNVAKRFCIAEGSMVLTPRGEIPIERVLLSDSVWDGVEWVWHDGVVCRGIKEVIEHNGLWATEDHEVWCADGVKLQHGDAAQLGYNLARTGAGRRPLQFVARDAKGLWIAPRRREAKTYDILNAGPRHRFTVSDRLVSNCFLVIYGGQKDRLFKTMSADRNPDGTRSFPGLDPQTVNFWFENWHRTHPWTRTWQSNVVAGWNQYGFVGTIIDGRKRFFLGGEDATSIPNMAIQGSASSIFNRGLIKIAKECPYQGWSALSGPILNVHDFLGLQVPEARAKEAEELLQTYMPYELNGMKFKVESKIAKSWDKV